MRMCNRCKERKEYSEFNKDTKSNTGVTTICKSCKNTQSKKLYQINRIERLQQIAEYRAKNPQIHLKQSAEYYKNNKDEIVIKRAMSRINNPDMFKSQWLRQNYGITIDDYRDMYSNQN